MDWRNQHGRSNLVDWLLGDTVEQTRSFKNADGIGTAERETRTLTQCERLQECKTMKGQYWKRRLQQ